ncbi:MAG: bifunctional ADP-heptose synthase [Bacteroidales bacterium]|jgi:rfaE bifunctional protein kinase chain/domain|nr:bifunctional ADP-heptose synthase [Bacteroidales bacterium]
MQKEKNYRQLFDDFNHLSIMIIGDVMVDSYLWGKVERISPEAPIPIVALRKRENRMGGAANVAMNIRSLGARPILCSVIGTDDKGDLFLDLLKKEKIESTGIIRSKQRITTTKFRIFGNAYQMLRVDEEVDHDLVENDFITLIRVIEQVLTKEKVDCIIFQDYDKGVITPRLIREVVAMAQTRKIPVTVDPKMRNFMAYQQVTLFKPNLKELKDGMNVTTDLGNRQAVMDVAQQLRTTLNCEYVLTTMSEKGMVISMKNKQEEKSIFVPAHMRSISDVSGAGDTVISVASLCLAARSSPYELAYISNLAGGLVCEEVGVVPISKEKLLKEVLTLL